MELKTIIIKMGLNNHGVVGIGLTRQVRRGDWRWTHVVASSVRNQAYLARPYAMCTKTQPPRKRCKAYSLRAVVRPDNSFACTQWPTTMAGYYAYHRTVWPGQFWLSEVTVCTRFPVAQGLGCRVTSLQESCLRSVVDVARLCARDWASLCVFSSLCVSTNMYSPYCRCITPRSASLFACR